MAAEVTSFLRLKQERSSNSEILITKDLLAGLSKVSDSESNLDSEQHGERAMRCNSPNTPLSSISASEDSENKKNDRRETKPEADFQGLNHFLEETCLDLKLQSSTRYQSVCTLDKVKSALQRAQKQAPERKRPSSSSSSPSSFSPSSGPLILSASSSFSSSSSSSGPGMFAAGCPGCLFYVITLKANPRCPHCNATVPSPVAVKKAKLDLNSSF